MKLIRRRGIILVSLLSCVILVSIGGGTVVTASPTTVGPPSPFVTDAVDPADGPASLANETPPHVDPDEYDEDGDPAAVRAWVAQRLTDRLETSATALEQGEYGEARERVDDEYGDRADQYATLASETGAVGDERDGNRDEFDDLPAPTDAFAQAQTDQRQLIDAAESYEEIRDNYERAAESGDTDAALEHARSLDIHAADVAAANESLQRQFTAIEIGTDGDLEGASDSVAAVDRRIRRTQTDVRTDQFTATTVTAAADDASVTPAESVTVNGSVRVQDGNGTWSANDSIMVDVNGDPQTVPIDENGQFTLEYRPEPLAPTADELTVRYRPEPGVEHLGNETTIPVSIEPVKPSLTGLETTDEVAYGETVSVSGKLEAGGTPVDGAPVELTIADTTLGEFRTTDGTFDESVTIPASISDGERELTVLVDAEDRAIEPTIERVPVTVRERKTDLSITTTEIDADDDRLRIEGTFTTAAGDPVGNQSIQVSVDDDPVGAVTTAADGSFNGTVSASLSGREADTTVDAIYEGTETNLAPTEASAIVESQATSGSSRLVDVRTALVVLVAVLGLGGLLAGAWRLGKYVLDRRRTGSTHSVLEDRSPGIASTRSSTTADETVEIPADSDSDSNSEASAPSSTRDPMGADLPVTISDSHAETLLTRASDHLSSGRTNEAVQSAYAAVRLKLQSDVEGGHTLTHSEFQQRYSGPQADDLELITEQYERATFGYEPISQATASEVLVHAQALLKLTTEDSDADLEGIVVED